MIPDLPERALFLVDHPLPLGNHVPVVLKRDGEVKSNEGIAEGGYPPGGAGKVGAGIADDAACSAEPPGIFIGAGGDGLVDDAGVTKDDGALLPGLQHVSAESSACAHLGELLQYDSG